MTHSAADETDLLAAARAGDRDAFARLIEPYRTELHAHCYRMLGSVHDADDALQESALKALRALDSFEGRSTVRAWLYAIATNTSLNMITRGRNRVLPMDFGPARDPHEEVGMPSETTWLEPYPDDAVGLADGHASPAARYELRESVELAFVAALQHLPPNQRAALILREVLGYPAREVAATLETSVASVNSALQRARATLDDRLPDRTQQATLRQLGDDELTRIVGGYVDALERGDVDAVVELLTEDAAWSMPPLPAWYHGRETLRAFLADVALSGDWRWRYVPSHANGQPAIGRYAWFEDEGAYLPFAIEVLTLDAGRITQLTSFMAPAALGRDPYFADRWGDHPPDLERLTTDTARFGLPARLEEE